MVHGGIPSVFVTSEVVAPQKIERLCSLAQQAEVLVACDSMENARDLSRAASAQGVDLGVVIEVETGLRRCGVQDIEDGVELAKGVHSLPGVSFRGIMSHQVIPEMPEREDRVTEGYRVIQGVIDLKDAIVAAGIPVEIVSTGETWSYDVAGEDTGRDRNPGRQLLDHGDPLRLYDGVQLRWQGTDHGHQHAPARRGHRRRRPEDHQHAERAAGSGRQARSHRRVNGP